MKLSDDPAVETLFETQIHLHKDQQPRPRQIPRIWTPFFRSPCETWGDHGDLVLVPLALGTLAVTVVTSSCIWRLMNLATWTPGFQPYAGEKLFTDHEPDLNWLKALLG